MPLIMPIKDLRNTTEISNIAHKEQEPSMQKLFLQNWRRNNPITPLSVLIRLPI